MLGKLGRPIALVVAAALLGAGWFAATDSGETAPADDVRAAADGVVGAWNTGDAEAFVASFTDQGLMQEFGFTSREEALAALPEFIGQPPITLRSFDLLFVSDFNALADIELGFGTLVERFHQDFRLVDGQWRLHTSRDLPAEIPAGANEVDLTLDEYSFSYDKSQVASGNFAFDVVNAGMEDHEIILARLGPDVVLEEAIHSEGDGPPEGVEILAVQAPIEPGDTPNTVFSEPLSEGRYALVCFFPSPDGTPHAFLGMTSEFTVGAPAPGGVGITPPDTGDGGLVIAGTAVQWQALAAVALVLLLAAAGGLRLSAVRR